MIDLIALAVAVCLLWLLYRVGGAAWHPSDSRTEDHHNERGLP